MRAPLLVLACMASLDAAPPSGIPRSLARERAALVSDVRYRLNFKIRAGADAVPGEATLAFQLVRPVSLLLDYREGTLRGATVNGAAIRATIENGHIELPAEKLRAGGNSVTLAFESPV